ncbi:MAG: 50S ribosomal protein L11 methyltransferase [Pyrinomonadaceae bacterium]|nr:50S ribosomal protein L11 methyltransferase [Pyrinomonadaceae bacterium]
MSSKYDHGSARLWYALDVDIDYAAREAVEYALMEAGALGTETNDVRQTSVCRSASEPDDRVNLIGQPLSRVTAYFDQTPDRELVRTELANALRLYDLPSSSVREMDFREVADEDWLGEWKKNWQPVKTGRFIVAPPWSEIREAGDQVVIRIEPGMAFGTGTHETTRLCLTAIEQYFDGGSLLDVGTGTGILAIAAAKVFPDAKVEACDTDPDAVAIARENARLNGVDGKIAFRVGTVEQATASANMVFANLTADVILSLLPTLLGATCGRLILSGILDSQAEAVNARLRECGVTGPSEIVQDGEWVAIVV